MNLRSIAKPMRAVLCAAILLAVLPPAARGQDRIRSLGVKWLRVGDLHSTFAIEGAEFEMHRTGNLTEQSDGLGWPAQYRFQDCLAAKSMWIGTTNFQDPVAGLTFPYKVVCAGPKQGFPKKEIMPVLFKMIGRFPAPEVLVDGLDATENKLDDMVDEFDPNLPADRMIVNVLNTSIGVTVTRKIMAFSQQNHNNYFIYHYTLKNTGIINLKGDRIDRTLTRVIFHLGHRYSISNEANKRGWLVAANANWGKTTVNETVGTDPDAADFEFRAQYSWYGRHSESAANGFDDLGSPDWKVSGTLGAARMVGVVTLHADKSAADTTDDLSQPKTTMFIGSDTAPIQMNQYDPFLMTKKYVDVLAIGHAPKTHAQLIGDGYANQFGNDLGGFTHGQGFGPYELAPGDSVNIILAEGVDGLDREKNLEVGGNWFRHWKKLSTDPMTMPDGTATTNFDTYKNAWVMTAKDSLFETFRHAISNYNAKFQIPQPPPPPEKFTVNSGGDRITISWARNAETYPTFDGYALYRAMGKPDTSYEMIFSCEKANATETFYDTTAHRGFTYYYYVVAKDDGKQNDIQPGVPLVSSKFYTMTSEPARLMRPASDNFKAIRVVPNPYHINARRLQFGEDLPDQIAFFGLPPKCTIRIFTERGDLIRTLQHTNGSGDELWDCTTEFKQVVVSGLYIAHIEITEDVLDTAGLLQIRKGDDTFRKFIIIR